jgi:hypothetical protein
VVEVAAFGAGGLTTHWGAKIAPGRARARDLHPSERLRLGATGPNDDHRFRYDAGVSVEAVAQEVVASLEQAEAWWARARGAEESTGDGSQGLRNWQPVGRAP